MNAGAAQKWANQSVAAADAVKGALAGIQSKTVTVTVLSNMLTAPASSTPVAGISTSAAVKRGYAKGTGGAASGWAWVGEAGPELVKFSGGERVIPSHVAKGYANGTEGDSTHEVHVYLDGRKIYTAMQDRAVSTQRRTGTNGFSKRTR
jgi:phage-related tail protein